MAVKLGASDAAFRLGDQAVSVYLGAVEVYAPGLTLYFNNAEEDGDWNTLGNWWLNAGHTVAATALPTAADSVVVTAGVNANSGSAPTVANLTVQGAGLNISATVTGAAAFNGGSFLDFSSTLTGNATFNNSVISGGFLTGNATFNDTSINYGSGTVTGTATFTGSACNDGGTAGTFVPDPPPSC